MPERERRVAGSSSAGRDPPDSTREDERPEPSDAQPKPSSASSGVSGVPWKPVRSVVELTELLQRLAATYSKAEPHYLQRKDRAFWWKRGSFPLVRFVSARRSSCAREQPG